MYLFLVHSHIFNYFAFTKLRNCNNSVCILTCSLQCSIQRYFCFFPNGLRECFICHIVYKCNRLSFYPWWNNIVKKQCNICLISKKQPIRDRYFIPNACINSSMKPRNLLYIYTIFLVYIY